MFSSWSQLGTSVILCGYAIAATAAPSYVSRQQAHICDNTPHKWAISYQGNIVGWLGSPKDAHPEKIGLVLDESAAHTFHNTCTNRNPSVSSMLCHDCDPKANMLQFTVASLSGYPSMSNASMIVAAAPTDPFALMDAPIWDFDGTEIANIALVGTPTVSPPFCYYDPSKQAVSILAVTKDISQATVLTQNCQIVAQ